MSAGMLWMCTERTVDVHNCECAQLTLINFFQLSKPEDIA